VICHLDFGGRKRKTLANYIKPRKTLSWARPRKIRSLTLAHLGAHENIKRSQNMWPLDSRSFAYRLATRRSRGKRSLLFGIIFRGGGSRTCTDVLQVMLTATTFVAPTPGGVCGLDYALSPKWGSHRLVSTPFLRLISGLGSALPCFCS